MSKGFQKFAVVFQTEIFVIFRHFVINQLRIFLPMADAVRQRLNIEIRLIAHMKNRLVISSEVNFTPERL
jgi:hypothetical protein